LAANLLEKYGEQKGDLKMVGQIGKRIFIGSAGEYYVMAELLKRGIISALAPRNTPVFDILAVKGKSSIKIRVKTKSQEIWQGPGLEKFRSLKWLPKSCQNCDNFCGVPGLMEG